LVFKGGSIIAKRVRRKDGVVASIDHSKCDNSPFCMVMRSCPQECFYREGSAFAGHKPQVDESECKGCGLCVNSCPHGAVAMEEVS